MSETKKSNSKQIFLTQKNRICYLILLNEIITIITIPNIFESGHLEIPSIYWNDLSKLFNL